LDGTNPIGRRAALLLGAAALARPAIAQQGFPNRPVRLICPWPAGGSADAVFRTIAEVAARPLGQTVLVENRSGASGTMGVQMMAAETRGDGHLIGQMPVTAFRLPAMTRRPTWDPMRDLSYIIHLTGYLFGVVVRSDSPWQDWPSFMAHARANPGQVTYGTPGVGSTLHITMEEIGRRLGIEFTHVPFRGGPDGFRALLSGDITAIADSTGWAPLVQEGRFRLLCTWGAERARRFPDAPTLKELGLDIVSESPFGMVGPKGIEPATVRRLHDVLKTTLEDPAVVAMLARFDMVPRYMDSEAYAAFARELNAQEAAAVRRLNLTTD
jgi:tripartite-type tricarboxylate transporter receptor subunit TctC